MVSKVCVHVCFGVDMGLGVVGLQARHNLQRFREWLPVLGCLCKGGRG